MKFLGTFAVAFVAFASVAYAADDPFANLYSNTLVYTTPKNVVIKVLVQKDGTWTSTSSDAKSDSGAWATVGSYVCVSDTAMPKVKPNCDKIVGHNIGDKWTQTNPDHTVDHVTLVSGR
jgi:hypothetical protein